MRIEHCSFRPHLAPRDHLIVSYLSSLLIDMRDVDSALAASHFPPPLSSSIVTHFFCVTAPMYRPFSSSRRWRFYVRSDSLAGVSQCSTSAAALVCVYRHLHDHHSRHLENDPTVGSCCTPKLRRAMWMRMHPVERWTSLVDLGRRGAYLIDKPVDMVSSPVRTPTPTSSDGRGTVSVLGEGDPLVCFTVESTEAHCQLCNALPYTARLHLCLSLLLWIRCLRDVQDTLARTRLPFAPVRRPQRYTVADVFPTRLSEYWVDVHTTVSTKMSALLNSTAEQIPAPHTWSAETSETIEDAATESTVTLNSGRVLHGHRKTRLSRKALLQQLQGVQPRASADDEMAARLVNRGSTGRRQSGRRRLLNSSSSSNSGGPTVEPTATSALRPASAEFACDAFRCVPSVPLDPEPLEDARYHGNDNRGEGCPLREDGTGSSAPIFIQVPPDECRTTIDQGAALLPRAEFLVRYCVMAHAAVLSSLFVEGRVADVRSNHPVVVAYVRWLFEDLVSKEFVSVTLLADDDKVAAHRPYFPQWCWRSVLVLLPPKHSEGYSAAVLRDWAARILRAAPCSILVEGRASTGYVAQLKDEVRLLQAAFEPESARVVEWVSVGTAMCASSTKEGCTGKAEEAAGHVSHDGIGECKGAHFQPQRCSAAVHSSALSPREITSALARFFGGWLMPAQWSKTVKDVSHHAVFLEAVRETLENRFYTCELLYAPTQSCLTPYYFERWVLEQLPENVRVIGINTSPLDVLYFFPQGLFLSQKVGNAFRYRAIDRTVVAKDMVPAWSSHPLRYAATRLKQLSRRWRRRGHDVASGLHAEFSPTDIMALQRAELAAATSTSTSPLHSRRGAKGTLPRATGEEKASHALVRERMVEYLAEPSKRTLLGLAVGRFLSV